MKLDIRTKNQNIEYVIYGIKMYWSVQYENPELRYFMMTYYPMIEFLLMKDRDYKINKYIKDNRKYYKRICKQLADDVFEKFKIDIFTGLKYVTPGLQYVKNRPFIVTEYNDFDHDIMAEEIIFLDGFDIYNRRFFNKPTQNIRYVRKI